MLAITINDADVENKFFQYAKSQKKAVEEIAIEAINYFMATHQDKTIIYTKKDPAKYLHSIKTDVNNEDLSDVKPYLHVENSGEYIHNLRRKSNA